MGLDPATLTAISIGTSVVTGGAQIMMAQQQAAAAAEAANRNTQAAYAELNARQQDAVDKASQDKSDRAKQADRELAALRVAMGETGGLGTVTSTRLAGEVGAIEGMDISRIEANRDREINALQRSKEAARINGMNAIKSAQTSANNQSISAVMNVASSGLQIATQQSRWEKETSTRQGRIPAPSPKG
jgi:hypothetical protein